MSHIYDIHILQLAVMEACCAVPEETKCIAFCTQAILAASAGLFVDIKWYYYCSLLFTITNFIFSGIFIYGIVNKRNYWFLLPYLIYVFVNFAQCFSTFLLVLWADRNTKTQVWLFLGYLATWLIIMPNQMILTYNLFIKFKNKKKVMKVKVTDVSFNLEDSIDDILEDTIANIGSNRSDVAVILDQTISDILPESSVKKVTFSLTPEDDDHESNSPKRRSGRHSRKIIYSKQYLGIQN